MNPAIPLFRTSIVAATLLTAGVSAEDSVRLVAIQATPKDAATLRADLADPVKGARSMAIDTLLKKGTVLLADFQEADPWRQEPVKMTKIVGEIKFGGQNMKDLGVVAGIEGGKFGPVTADALDAEIALPGKGQTYRSYGVMGNTTVAKSGRWQERAWWGDGKDTFMLWQYATVNAPADPAKRSETGSWDCVRVEMRWFQAAEADLAKLAQAKPESRDKAMEWLSGKAKLWKECGFRARTGERSMWHSLEVELDMKDGEVIERQDGLSLDGSFSGQGGDLKMEWDVEAFVKEKGPTSFKLTAPMAPGVWVFLPVKDVANSNVVACRLSRD